MSAFRNVTRGDLLHGIANRKEFYKNDALRAEFYKKRSKNQHESVTERVYQREQSVSTKYDEPKVLKLSDIINLAEFINKNFKEGE